MAAARALTPPTPAPAHHRGTGLVPAALLHNFSYLGQCDDKPQPDRRRGEYYGNFGRVSAATPTSTWHWEQYSVANFDAYGCGPPDGSSGCNVVLMLLSRHAFKAQQQQMHSQHARQTNAYVKQGIRVSHSRHALRQKEQGRMQ